MPDFPPLMRGVAAADPRAEAIAAARAGCDGGTIFWRADGDLAAALVLAPDVPLRRALQMLPLTAIALRDAIGAIGPAEMPVHLTWDGRLLVNGGEAGRVRAVAPDGNGVPDWLVTDLALRLRPEEGAPPERTALHAEGAGEVAAEALLESWSRHLMHRLSEWEDGPRPLHAELSAALWERASGDVAFVGLDEDFGRLRRDGDAIRLDPLTLLLEAP